MFEKVIKRKKNRITDIIQINSDKLLLTEFNNSTIPEYCKKFVNSEIKWWIYQEQVLRRSSIHFDFNNDEFNDIDLLFNNYLEKYSFLDERSFNLLIDSAIKSELNYLSRPRTTLKEFTFRGETVKTKQEVNMRLDYFANYDYLISGIRLMIEKYFPENDNDSFISFAEFDRIVGLVDNDYLLELTPLEFVELLEPLFSFYSESDSKEAPIPATALSIFMDDKGYHPIKAAIDDFIESNSSEHISYYQFEEILFELIKHYEDTIVMPEQDSGFDEVITLSDESIQQTEFSNIYESEIEQSEINTEATEIPDDESELAEDLSNVGIIEETVEITAESLGESNYEDKSDEHLDISDEMIGEESDSEPAQKYKPYQLLKVDEDFDLSSTDNDIDDFPIKSALNNQSEIIEVDTDYQSEIEQLDDGAKQNAEELSDDFINEEFSLSASSNYSTDNERDIRGEMHNYDTIPISSIIDDKSESKFIKRLFNYDVFKYNQLIESIDKCNSWKDAATFLDLYFAENAIEPNSTPAIEFRNLIQLKYIGSN